MNTTYRHAGIGGTFDHFHAGHELLIRTAFNKAEYVSIGIATDDFIQGKDLPNSIQPYNEREKSLKSFLTVNNLIGRANIFPLTDIFGTAITDQTIDTLIVTKETKPNALHINEIRKKYNMIPCRIITIPYIKGKKNKIIRSSYIRRGEMNRTGNQYLDIFREKAKLVLPVSLRDTLREPLGIIIEGTEENINKTGLKATSFLKAKQPIMTITVGDIASQSLRQTRFQPDISVVDFKTRRTNLLETHELPKNGYIFNPPGTLCREAVLRLYKNICNFLDRKTSAQIIIKGEEDLLTLPAILIAPLGSAVVYGQYEIGLIVVLVDEVVKEKVAAIIRRFE